MSLYTVIGGNGFIGSAVVNMLHGLNENVWIPKKNDELLYKQNLGTVIYCAGNGNCQESPFKVLDSNTTLLASLLEYAKFERLIYLSSARVYIDNNQSAEIDQLVIDKDDNRKLFNLTKLVAEDLCIQSNKNILILRPSNVYGLAFDSPLFLPMIVKNALKNNKIDMYVSPQYEKDYLSVFDLVKVIEIFCLDGWNGCEVYNVAAGYNISAQQIADLIQVKTGCEIIWHNGFYGEKFPPINISKLKQKVDFSPSYVLDDLLSIIDEFSFHINS